MKEEALTLWKGGKMISSTMLGAFFHLDPHENLQIVKYIGE